ncbi:MAG TPA: alkaline phosphatase D family protein [Allosphingosinicella sp.]|jgi:alkaline phosphatase D|nr:alkaline phosphatase D family protein [Allosphingosinicella sp.]
MSIEIDRRLLLKAGALGLGALAVPGVAQVLAARGFTHDVASGEPRQRSVMLWTRYVPGGGGSGRLSWQVSPSADFGRIAADGVVTAEEEHDHCVKPVATGLAAGRWYFYRFRDAAGAWSPVGRTRTLPEGPVARFTIGLFSCSNLAFGWFNAYGHAAARRDIDLIAHVGDYLYEYQRGRYPEAAEAVAGRILEPASEIVHLADYRLRFAAYRRDPDLQRLHRLFPMIAMWDDHESANDSWRNGAQNHQQATEGDWADRKAASMRAYREWMPVSDDLWESYEIGDLATLFRPETRLTARSRSGYLQEVLRNQPDRAAALAAFRDGPWQDPARTLMGPGQEAWLADGLRRSVGRRAKWQVIAQQVIMGTLAAPPETEAWLGPEATSNFRGFVANAVDAGRAGLPFNHDDWNGYPQARRRLLQSALDAESNLVVLSGDSHNAWAFDLDLDGHAAGIEIAGTSVTSPGNESDFTNVAPAEMVRATVARNPQLKWANLHQRGYATLTLTPERATAEWLFLDTIRQRSTRIAARHRMTGMRGSNRFG